MKLYSGPLSLFTAKVRIALTEKQLDYERIDVPFSRAKGYEPKHPDVVRLNPRAQVPVLVDDEIVLELKTVRRIEDIHFVVVKSYLKATGLEHGLILNFAKPKLEIKRVRSSAEARS